MFEYFPKNYTWSFSAVRAVDTSGAISEVDEACRTLQEASLRNDRTAQEAWYTSWKKLGDRIAALASENEGAGQLLSAGRKYRRASIYFSMAERMLPHPHAWRDEAGPKALSAFEKSVKFRKEPVEWVRIPFEQLPSCRLVFLGCVSKRRQRGFLHFNAFSPSSG